MEATATGAGIRADAYAFDLDGTIYLRDIPLPGALDLLARLTADGVPHLFVTNNSSTTASAYLAKLRNLGLSVSREQLITSNDVTVAHMRRSNLSSPYLVATDEVRAEYASLGITHEEASPDSVLLAFDTSIDFAKLTLAARLIDTGLPYLATHPDVSCPVPEGFLPDVGSFIKLFEALTGRVPVVLGKPTAAMAAMISERLGLKAGNIAFVGDRLETDMLMAREYGFKSILTLTGVTRGTELEASGLRPDHIVDDMHALSALIGLGDA